jgi:hypothetical protein
LLSGVPEGSRVGRAADLVKSQYKRRMNVTRVEPLMDAEMEVTGYMAYTQP